MTCSNSLFPITNVAVPERWNFFRIIASATEAVAVMPSGNKTFLAGGIANFMSGPSNLFKRTQ